MADFRAIEAVGQSLLRLLRMSYSPDDFDNELQFRLYGPDDFAKPMSAGVSIFLYRILQNGTHRTPAGRRNGQGRRFYSSLPVDLYFLMTVWAKDVSLQYRIAGWLMRTLEDTPVLPYGLLDAAAPGVFRQGETVEVVLWEITNEDLFHLWESLAENEYQLSIPYMARNLFIESRQKMTEGEPVQERIYDAGELS